MRRLLLFRHAKAERAASGERDSERALTGRGCEDAERIGAYIARHGLAPDQALVSPSARTQETWKLAAGHFRPAPPMTSEPRIYEASADTLLSLVKNAPAQTQILLLIGHNPGMHEFATTLVASGDLETRERLREKLPAAGLAVIDFVFDDWERLRGHTGRLERFVTPKSIEAAIN